jgi:putative Mn2+ efflux pump MntP
MNNILRLLGKTFIAACVISVITLIIGWTLKWNSNTQYSNGFFIAGTLLIVLGLLSVIGGFSLRADRFVVYSQSAGDMNTFERSKRWITDMVQSYNAFSILLLTGLYLIAFAILIPNIF